VTRVTGVRCNVSLPSAQAVTRVTGVRSKVSGLSAFGHQLLLYYLVLE
jgi:hypothetical protein